MAELAAVASIIQIADVGFRLSVRLYQFAETVANADKAIHFTSKDVALTSSVLKEVGEVLRNDQSFRTYSSEAVKTATAIVTECSNVFQDMDKILADRVPGISSRSAGRGSRASMTLERFKWPYWQPKIQLLRSNLDRLRSTLSVMLNVIIYRRLSDKEPASVHASQMTLIRDLIKSEQKHIQKYEKLKNSIMDAGTKDTELLVDSDESPTLSSSRIVGILGEHSSNKREDQTRKVPATAFDHKNETNVKYVRHLMSLFDRLIIEVNTPGYQIGQRSRERIRYHVYKARSGEVSQLYNLHGKSVIDQTLKINDLDPDIHLTPADFQEGRRQKQKRRREDRENSTDSDTTRRRRNRRSQDLVSLRYPGDSTQSRPNPLWQRQDDLNEFFVSGEGIHREVLQQEICGFLGPEAYFRPSTYNGKSGWVVTAVRPFTPKMLEDLVELSTSYCTEIRKLQERPLPQSDMGSLPPSMKISEHRPSFRPYITRSGSTYDKTRHTSGYADSSETGYADLRAYSRMDPRATGSNMYPSHRHMPSYRSGMSLPGNVPVQGFSDDPRSYNYFSSIPPLQSGTEIPFQSDRPKSFRRGGNILSVYPPQGPYRMRDNGKAQSLREEQRPSADLNSDPRDSSNNYTDLTGLTSQEERGIAESHPVLDTTKSRTLNELGETLISEPVGARARRTSAPILHSNADEPHSSLETPDASQDQVTEWLGTSEPSLSPKDQGVDYFRVPPPVSRTKSYTPLQRHGAYDGPYGPAESDHPKSSCSTSPSRSPPPKVQTSEEKMELEAQKILDDMLGLWKPVPRDQ